MVGHRKASDDDEEKDSAMARDVEATHFDRSEAMGRENIPKLLLRFSGPAILAAETTAFYNLFDAIWCGRLAEEALAALSVANPLMAIFRAIAESGLELHL